MTETDPAPAVSAEGRRLIRAVSDTSHWCGDHRDDHDMSYGDLLADADAAENALSAYIAGLEARNAELLRQREEAWAAWQDESDRHAETCAELYALKDTAYA